MTHIGNEPGCDEIVGNDAQSRPDLPAIADAPPLAPLSEGGEGHAASGQGLDAHEVLYQQFKAGRDGGEVLLRQGSDRQAFDAEASDAPVPIRQGFGGQAPLHQGLGSDIEELGERLRPIDITDLIALDIPPRGLVLDPIIPEKGLAMLYGARGVGKTRVAHGIGYAGRPARASCAGGRPSRAGCC